MNSPLYVNKFVILGNFTKDPEIKESKSGSVFAEICLATNRSKKNGDSWEAIPDYHYCIAFGKVAERLAGFRKGEKIYVEGTMQTQSWTGSDGKKRYKTAMVITSYTMCERKSGGAEKVAPKKSSKSELVETAEEVFGVEAEELDDPFA